MGQNYFLELGMLLGFEITLHKFCLHFFCFLKVQKEFKDIKDIFEAILMYTTLRFWYIFSFFFTLVLCAGYIIAHVFNNLTRFSVCTTLSLVFTEITFPFLLSNQQLKWYLIQSCHWNSRFMQMTRFWSKEIWLSVCRGDCAWNWVCRHGYISTNIFFLFWFICFNFKKFKSNHL